MLDWSVFLDSRLISYRGFQDTRPWFSNRRSLSNPCQPIHVPQPLFQRDECASHDSYNNGPANICNIHSRVPHLTNVAECAPISSTAFPDSR
jgi:hypothetical protein